jgi:hypothetical protein
VWLISGLAELARLDDGIRVEVVGIFLNPENQAIAYVSVYVPTAVEEYVRRLRPPREKRQR